MALVQIGEVERQHDLCLAATRAPDGDDAVAVAVPAVDDLHLDVPGDADHDLGTLDGRVSAPFAAREDAEVRVGGDPVTGAEHGSRLVERPPGPAMGTHVHLELGAQTDLRLRQ